MADAVGLVNAADDDLLVLVLEAVGLLDVRTEQVRLDVEQESLEPDVKEIGCVGILDHVVVGRVRDNHIDGCVAHRQGGCRRHAQAHGLDVRAAPSSTLRMAWTVVALTEAQVPAPSPGPVSKKSNW